MAYTIIPRHRFYRARGVQQVFLKAESDEDAVAVMNGVMYRAIEGIHRSPDGVAYVLYE